MKTMWICPLSLSLRIPRATVTSAAETSAFLQVRALILVRLGVDRQALGVHGRLLGGLRGTGLTAGGGTGTLAR